MHKQGERLSVLCGISDLVTDYMTDVWLITTASLPNLDRHSIIRSLVKPVIDNFQDNLSTFHFFFEPYILLRIKAEEDLITQQIQPYIERRLSELNATNPSVHIDPSYSEEPSYGEGWEIAQKMFEFGGRSAILKAESDIGNVQLGPEFNEGKFMHLLLNQWGYSTRQEALLHFKIVGERFAVIYSGTNIDLVRERLPQILSQLESRFFSQIEDSVRRTITES